MNEAANPDRRTSGTSWIGIGITVGVVLLIVLGFLGFRIARSKRAWAAFVAQGLPLRGAGPRISGPAGSTRRIARRLPPSGSGSTARRSGDGSPIIRN